MAEGGDRVSGIVRWFSGQKGFGFIAPDGASEGDDVFVHQTSIRSDGFRTLGEGETVEFIIDVGEDGRSKAVDVVSLTRSGEGSGRGRGRGRRGGRGGRRGGRAGVYDDEGYEGGGYGRGERGGGAEGGGRGGACYTCGRTGHLARDCYQNNRGGDEFCGSGRGEDSGGGRGRGGYGGRRGRGVSDAGGTGEYIGGGRGGGGRKCYNCGEEGHLARDCLDQQT